MVESITRRYRVQGQIGSGAMGVVYRVDDRLTGQVVALKRVTQDFGAIAGASSTAQFDFRLALAQEFKTLASLRHPNIISVLDYGFDDEQIPFYTMDYLEQQQPFNKAAAGQPLATQVDYIVQIFQALAYLHRRGIVHRDLKPANVVVVDGIVKVLDFGLATKPQTPDAQVVGTLTYIAPEILRGQTATPQSDLYAVGVMAYELFAGQHPFVKADVSDLISAILDEEPDITALDVPEGVARVVKRLLAKDPNERYDNASEIIEAYNQSVNRQIAYETPTTRESFLQAAEFVGRKNEVQQLWESVQLAIDGQGSSWLIGGESGVGKSRLLEELRVRALVEGMLVLRGQAVAESRSPYYLWRQVLRWIAMMSPLNALEASILKTVVPDIASVIDKEVADAPSIDPQAAQERLFKIVERVFRRQQRPLMIVLEDLQWARDGLDMLERFNKLVAQHPIFLLASFRNDEAPNLPKRFPEMALLELKPFDEQTIAALCETMLGTGGKNVHLIDLVQQETKGNVFLVVEAIRTLAEDAGGLEQIGKMTLPNDLLGGGSKIIQRRINRVPADALPTLKIAALIGKELDLKLLHYLAPEVKQMAWLTACSDAGVIVVQNEVWSFAHDKIREGLIKKLDSTTRQQLHRQIASAIEAIYPQVHDYDVVLAYHWQEAGENQKAAQYAASAGEQALNQGAHEAAVQLLEQARALSNAAPLEQAHIEQQLSEAKYGLGQLLEAKDHSDTTLKILGLPLPDDRFTVPRLLYGFLRQVGHRWFPKRLSRHDATNRARFLEATRAYQRLSVTHYMRNDTIPTVAGTVHAINYAESAGSSPELARAISNFAVAIALLPPLQKTAEGYFNRALRVAEHHQEALNWVHLTRGVFYLGMGRLKEAKTDLERAIEVAAQIGNQRGVEEAHSILSIRAYHVGHFEDGMNISQTLQEDALALGALHNYGSAVVSHAANRLRHGKLDMTETFAHLEKVMQETADLGYRIVGYSTLALGYLRMGDMLKALENARHVTDITFHSSATSAYSLIGYIHTAEVFLQLWEQGDATQADNARKACKALQGYTGSFPFGKPAAERCMGILYWLEGNADKARQAWQKSLEAGAQHHMPYEQARTHIEIARHQPVGHAQRTLHLGEATGLLINLQAPSELEQVQALQAKRV
jgi:tetratricopeptide (TPR) repeat protein/tRNA A-37 threonylcarbamoyl transferase component Bud32